jgi:hypothetical protein
MSKWEVPVRSRDAKRGNECPANSPLGWHCTLPAGHPGNHVGTTGDYEALYQWPPDKDES